MARTVSEHFLRRWSLTRRLARARPAKEVFKGSWDIQPADNDFWQRRLKDRERRATEVNPPMSKVDVTGLGNSLEAKRKDEKV